MNGESRAFVLSLIGVGLLLMTLVIAVVVLSYCCTDSKQEENIENVPKNSKNQKLLQFVKDLYIPEDNNNRTKRLSYRDIESECKKSRHISINNAACVDDSIKIADNIELWSY